MPDDVPTMTGGDGRIASVLCGDGLARFEREVLPAYVNAQRWFAGKGQGVTATRLRTLGTLDGGRHVMAVVEVETGGEVQSYFLPLTVVDGSVAATRPVGAILARLDGDGGALVDGASDADVAETLLAAMRAGEEVAGEGGTLVFEGRNLPADPGAARPMGVEQSNASVAFGDAMVLKLYRRIRPGLQPDIEMGRFLTDRTDFAATPALLGTIVWRDEAGEETVLAAASDFVRNRGDAWAFVSEGLDRAIAAGGGAVTLEVGGADLGALLGRRTAEMHLALGSGEGAFGIEPLDAEGLRALVAETEAEVARSLDRLAQARLDGESAEIAASVVARRDDILARIRRAGSMTPSGGAGRVHGDYHLGQVLVTEDDLAIIDFEGEPSRSLAERQAKSSPLRDVAGMLRSFDYAARSALDRQSTAEAKTAAQVRDWRAATSGAFVDAWRETMGATPLRPDDTASEAALLDLFLLRKCAYEVDYERDFRPAWIDVPLRGMLHVLEEAE